MSHTIWLMCHISFITAFLHLCNHITYGLVDVSHQLHAEGVAEGRMCTNPTALQRMGPPPPRDRPLQGFYFESHLVQLDISINKGRGIQG